MNNKKWMIYGANGYTGRLVVDEAVVKGLTPILAGRSNDVKTLAKKHNFESIIFDLQTVDQIANYIKGLSVVANCAGPFSQTAEKMMRACIKTGAHFIDITLSLIHI